MKTTSENMGTAGNVVKSGVTQPRPSGPTGNPNPGARTGAVPNIGGNSSPIVVKTGATNNGSDNLPRRGGNR